MNNLRLFLIILLLYSLFQNCSSSKHSLLKRIEVYYLSWNLHPSNLLSESEVRNYFNKKNDYFLIEDKKVLKEFEMSFYSNEKKSIELQNFDTRMVIDFIYSDSTIKTFCISTTKVIKEGNVYYINLKALDLIKKYIPETNAPY